MKRQQINLLNPELLSAKVWLNLRVLFFAIAALVVLIGIAYAGLRYHLTKLVKQQQVISTELDQTKQKLDLALALRAPKPVDPALEAKVAKIELEISNYRLMLNFLKENTFVRGKGPSLYLEALSNQTLSGLWLEKVVIDDSHKKLELTGQTLATNLIPRYITALGQETAFVGREFATLESKAKVLTQSELNQILNPSSEEKKTVEEQSKYQLSQFVLKAKELKEDSSVTRLTQKEQP